ncbi:MAG: GTPase domain-containing protein [Promethearchaeota archaeon]
MEKITDFLIQLKNAKHLVRMTIVGDGAVGKTTMVQAMLRKTVHNNHDPLSSDQLENKKVTRTPFIEIESWSYKDLIFQCYDLAGQRTPGVHPVDILKNQVLNLIDIYVFVFSLDRYESFENINNWIQLMNFDDRSKNENLGLILVGNKVDLERNVSNELIQSLIGEDKYFNTYVETSSIYGIGIGKLLDEIVKMSKKLLNMND